MINIDRIVPVTVIDLLTLYGVIMALAGIEVSALDADDVIGDFTVSEAGTYLAAQPVKTVDVTAGAGTVYFVAAYDFAGFISGTAVVNPTGDEITPDARTLYKAEISAGAVAVTKIGF